MATTIQWGILGLGNIANKFAQDLVKVKGAALHAVGSRDKNKAQQFANTYNAKVCYSSYEELAADPKIQIIYIATPHSLHYENTMMCLNAGKSVLCEKPIGLNSEQAGEMMTLAREKNLFLMEGIWTRFIPATQKVLDLLKEGAIGDIFYIKSDFGFRVTAPPESRLLDPKLGGGALLDIGIYPLYLSLLLLGEPEHLKAEGILDSNGIDLYCAVMGSFKNGVKAVMESSFISNTPTEAFIYGTSGFIHMKSQFHNCREIEVYHNDTKTSKVYSLPITGHGYFHEIMHVQNCLNQGKTESDLLPLGMSLSLSQNLDRIKNLISLKYDA